MRKQKAYFFLESEGQKIDSFVEVDIQDDDIYYFLLEDGSKNRFCISEKTFTRETDEIFLELDFYKINRSSLFLKKECLEYELTLHTKSIQITQTQIEIKYLLNEIEYRLKIKLVGEKDEYN